MYSKVNRTSRWADAAGSAEHLVCVRFTGIEWQYLEGSSWTGFVPLSTDVLLARLEFDNQTETPLEGVDEEYFTVKMGYLDGDLTFKLGSDVVTIEGTSFVARCGEDLWCQRGRRPSDSNGAFYCCSSDCSSCGGADCATEQPLGICCLETLQSVGRVCRDHDDVSCLIPESMLGFIGSKAGFGWFFWPQHRC